MVQLSNDAAELIRTLVADHDLPSSAGLRLGTDEENHSLAMHLEPGPQEFDVVLEQDGASLFVSPDAAPRLGDQTLHAQLTPRPAFFVD